MTVKLDRPSYYTNIFGPLKRKIKPIGCNQLNINKNYDVLISHVNVYYVIYPNIQIFIPSGVTISEKSMSQDIVRLSTPT